MESVSALSMRNFSILNGWSLWVDATPSLHPTCTENENRSLGLEQSEHYARQALIDHSQINRFSREALSSQWIKQC